MLCTDCFLQCNPGPMKRHTNATGHDAVYVNLVQDRQMNWYRDKVDPPYVCSFCNIEMDELEVVHHLDHDVTNNDITNLAAAHNACHNSHHHKGKRISDAQREKLSDALTGRTLSKSHINALTAQHTCDDCGYESTRTWITRHKNEGMCV